MRLFWRGGAAPKGRSSCDALNPTERAERPAASSQPASPRFASREAAERPGRSLARLGGVLGLAVAHAGGEHLGHEGGGLLVAVEVGHVEGVAALVDVVVPVLVTANHLAGHVDLLLSPWKRGR